MIEMEPTIDEWKSLYEAAINFKQQECWNHMWDSDIFGVQNPESGEVGYCCVMGRNGEHFALGVYKGCDGLDGLIRIFNNEVHGTSINALHVQNCLMASFEDRKLLSKQDHEIIKKLGLKFRGKKAWPLFRDYTPGFHPWYLNSRDVRFLTLALNQSNQIAKRMRENPDMLISEDDSLFLVRVAYNDEDETKWKDEWLEPTLITTKVISQNLAKGPSYNNHLENIRKGKKKHRDIWEIGTFYSPKGVQENNERPYYPKIILYADHNSGMILSLHMAQHSDYQEEFFEHFLTFLENSKYLPKEILASDEEILELIFQITKDLKIELFQTNYLDIIEDAQYSMFNFFRS